MRKSSFVWEGGSLAKPSIWCKAPSARYGNGFYCSACRVAMPPQHTQQAAFRWSFGRGAIPEEQHALVSRSPATPSSAFALSRLQLKPAMVAMGAQRNGSKYACLAPQGGTCSGDESGDDEEGVALPQQGCRRCCLFCCVLVLMAGGTGAVLRILLASDGHPSSPAANLASRTRTATTKTTLRGPKTILAKSTAVPLGTRSSVPASLFVPPWAPYPPWPPSPPPRAAFGDELPESDASLDAEDAFIGRPPPLYIIHGAPPPPSPPRRYSPPWPPWPPAPNPPNPPPEPSPPPPPSPPMSPPSFPGPSPHPPPTPPCAPWPPLIQSPPPPSPPLPLRELGLLTIPAVAARANELKRYGKGWVEMGNNTHQKKEYTRETSV